MPHGASPTSIAEDGSCNHNLIEAQKPTERRHTAGMHQGTSLGRLLDNAGFEARLTYTDTLIEGIAYSLLKNLRQRPSLLS